MQSFTISLSILCLCVCVCKVENDRCESQRNAVRHNLLVNTGPGDWRRMSVKLKAGVNILSWQVYGLQLDAVSMTTNAAVKIRLIEIRGRH